MCITNQFVENTLKSIRSFEAGGENDERKLAELLASIKIIQDCLEENEKKIKAQFKNSYSGEVHYFSDLGKKVYLSEGKTSKEYDNTEVYHKLIEVSRGGKFFNMVKIQQNLIPEDIKKVVDNCAKISKGDSYITVYKMNKQELIEHTV